jgi:acetylornithine deacetylase/succinyl-diaminopimelate desuccinylase-like protein
VSRILAIVCGLAILHAAGAVGGATPAPAADRDLALDVLRELIAINTAPSGGPGATRRAAQAMAARLVAAGFPQEDVRVLGLAADDGNLVARYRGSGSRRPILLMAHLDVVEALPEDWSLPPFVLTQRDGYLYGRGSLDNKGGAAMLVANFVRMRRDGHLPDRDLIMVLSADEETTGANIRWLLEEQRPLVDAEYALNTDGGAVLLDGDRPQAFTVQTSEKIYASYHLEVTNPGGHSSLPRRDNAIYALADALRRLRAHEFPIELNDTTRVFFQRWRALAPEPERALVTALGSGRLDAPELADLPEHAYLNALARTTCVATELQAGHAENALPQRARATVNCRIVPTSSAAEVEATLQRVAATPGLTIAPVDPALPSPPSPLNPELFGAVEALAGEFWPGVPIVPEMSTGATDGLFVRNAGIPCYGVSAVAEDPDDDRAHGRDERMRTRSFEDALEFLHRLLLELSR